MLLEVLVSFFLASLETAGHRLVAVKKCDGVFWGPRGCYIFLNNIFNYLKGNCVLRTLARSPLQKIASLFFGRDRHTHIHTHIHTYTHTHIHTYTHTYIHTRLGQIPKKCLLGLCLECETFIRGVFCPNLFVCLCVCVCLSAFFEKNK
jgi:hypothetical protein